MFEQRKETSYWTDNSHTAKEIFLNRGSSAAPSEGNFHIPLTRALEGP